MKLHLDPGEAEAIVLAKELKAEFLIIDERKGRRIAAEHGLRITGLLGVLVRGKQKGYITKLTPILDKLVQNITCFRHILPLNTFFNTSSRALQLTGKLESEEIILTIQQRQNRFNRCHRLLWIRLGLTNYP